MRTRVSPSFLVCEYCCDVYDVRFRGTRHVWGVGGVDGNVDSSDDRYSKEPRRSANDLSAGTFDSPLVKNVSRTIDVLHAMGLTADGVRTNYITDSRENVSLNPNSQNPNMKMLRYVAVNGRAQNPDIAKSYRLF